MSIKFTVACVCLNAVGMIEKTLKSVLEQDYPDVEVIFVDGLSSDGTYEYLCKYEHDGRIILIHEKDFGIYDAMNKAVRAATGDYIYFLGSGDVFYDAGVLKRISEEIELHTRADAQDLPVVVCGNFETVYYDDSDKNRVFDFYHHPNMSGIRRACGFPTSHQAFLVRTNVMKKKEFDTSYTYQADQEILAYCLKHYKNKLLMIDVLIAKFDGRGVTSRALRKDMQIESDRLNRKYNAFWHYIIYIPKMFARMFVLCMDKKVGS